MDNRSIGIYDSGMGGLSLWRIIREYLPFESLTYLGDGKNCPYGSKSRDQVESFAHAAIEKLIACGCKMVVVACNTATAASIDSLRLKYPNFPIVGMEPAIKPACQQTKSRVVGVLATEGSLHSEMFTHTMDKYATGIEVVMRAGTGFVELVENGEEHSDKARETIEPIINDMIERGVDKIVLGCTHYPFLIDQFKDIIKGRDIDIIDPSPAIARRVEQLLSEGDILADSTHNPSFNFLSFAGDDYCEKLRFKAMEK